MRIEEQQKQELGVLIPADGRYYKAPIKLEEAERYITSGLVTAARAYVANGYYLRRIRDDRLYKEDGYSNFENYVRDRYGKNKGWASKCIKVNQKLSVDGDSPLLDSRYQEYSTYQLVELAYMTEEQREQASPEQTVKELHEIRMPEKPEESEPEEVAMSQLPDHSMDYGTRRAYCNAFARMLLTRFWDWFAEDHENRVLLVVQSEAELKSRFKETWYFRDPILEQGVAHINLFDEYIQIWDGNGQCLGNAEWFYLCASVQAMWNEISLERAEQAAAEMQQTEASCCETAVEEEEDNVPGQMEITDCPEYLPEGYQVEETALPEETQEPGQTFQMPAESIFPRVCSTGKNPNGNCVCCGSGGVQCCEDCQEDCNTRCGWCVKTDENWNFGDLPQAKERYLRELAEKFVGQPEHQVFLIVGKPDEWMLIHKIQSWNDGQIPLADGVVASASAEIVEFFRGDEDLGCASYQRLITQIGKALDAHMENQKEDAGAEATEEPDKGKFLNTQISEYDRKILLDMIQNAKEVLEHMEDYWRENQPRTYTKRWMELQAYVAFLEQHDRLEEEPEPEKQEQEPFPIFRNNDQRKEWLKDYQSWPVWFEVPEASEVYYRYDLPDGSSLVMCEYHQWYSWREQFGYGGDPDGIGTREYILPAGGYHYLEDCKTNRSAMIEKLKEVQKNGK